MSCSFFRSRLVQALVVVSVVKSSIYALIGGSQRPSLSCSTTTHSETQMMTSMAMVMPKGEIVHPAMIPVVLWCIH